MANEELFSIVERVKNGEKPEDIIDFSRKSIDGYSPEKALEFIKQITTCKVCGKSLENNEMFVCSVCLQNKEKLFKLIDEQPDNGWGYIFALLIFATLSNDKNNDKNNKK